MGFPLSMLNQGLSVFSLTVTHAWRHTHGKILQELTIKDAMSMPMFGV